MSTIFIVTVRGFVEAVYADRAEAQEHLATKLSEDERYDLIEYLKGI